jgi:hypothetical protein
MILVPSPSRDHDLSENLEERMAGNSCLTLTQPHLDQLTIPIPII